MSMECSLPPPPPPPAPCTPPQTSAPKKKLYQTIASSRRAVEGDHTEACLLISQRETRSGFIMDVFALCGKLINLHINLHIFKCSHAWQTFVTHSHAQVDQADPLCSSNVSSSNTAIHVFRDKQHNHVVKLIKDTGTKNQT